MAVEDFQSALMDNVRDRMAFVARNRDMLVVAFMAETGFLPSECELVEETKTEGLTITTRVYVRKRG